MNKVLLILLLTMITLGSNAQVTTDTTLVDVEQMAKSETAKMPKYKSGMASVVQYVMNNLKDPKEADENGVEGKVLMTFVVDKDGSLTQITPLRTAVHFFDVKKLSEKTGINEQELINHYGQLFQEEGIRILAAMPKWKPGMLNGEPVRVKYTLPVTFAIPRFAKYHM